MHHFSYGMLPIVGVLQSHGVKPGIVGSMFSPPRLILGTKNTNLVTYDLRYTLRDRYDVVFTHFRWHLLVIWPERRECVSWCGLLSPDGGMDK